MMAYFNRTSEVLKRLLPDSVPSVLEHADCIACIHRVFTIQAWMKLNGSNEDSKEKSAGPLGSVPAAPAQVFRSGWAKLQPR